MCPTFFFQLSPLRCCWGLPPPPYTTHTPPLTHLLPKSPSRTSRADAASVFDSAVLDLYLTSRPRISLPVVTPHLVDCPYHWLSFSLPSSPSREAGAKRLPSKQQQDLVQSPSKRYWPRGGFSTKETNHPPPGTACSFPDKPLHCLAPDRTGQSSSYPPTAFLGLISGSVAFWAHRILWVSHRTAAQDLQRLKVATLFEAAGISERRLHSTFPSLRFALIGVARRSSNFRVRRSSLSIRDFLP